MRVYLPATVGTLRQLVADEVFTPVNGTGFALTPALRESYTSGDTEELEYAALLEAARASLRLIAAEDGAEPARRVVVSADVGDSAATLRPDLDSAAVRVSGPVSLADIVAVHVDTAEAEPAVRAAADVVDAADLGDPDAEFAIGETEDHQLAWYATQELPFLLDLM
ncbi:hypothetical protein SAMN05421810_102304 [Amycolatopsis arida]|uniref:Uncharacterized protein n=1 Tax=Amycolatopsis arida TaxID=587909 RepID=A0A1I5PIA2_9PSEU|nr:hypothetical protein [Amycolatopsis arida]TDX98512.1 hypothetical protein CLV69_101304 [Amycolatopsis arida]SFP33824.1 hypothetical protein SAMN05421810_102304 [Amycolatopsis arida]